MNLLAYSNISTVGHSKNKIIIVFIRIVFSTFSVYVYQIVGSDQYDHQTPNIVRPNLKYQTELEHWCRPYLLTKWPMVNVAANLLQR